MRPDGASKKRRQQRWIRRCKFKLISISLVTKNSLSLTVWRRCLILPSKDALSKTTSTLGNYGNLLQHDDIVIDPEQPWSREVSPVRESGHSHGQRHWMFNLSMKKTKPNKLYGGDEKVINIILISQFWIHCWFFDTFESSKFEIHKSTVAEASNSIGFLKTSLS